jgi:SET domain-containing protein
MRNESIQRASDYSLEPSMLFGMLQTSVTLPRPAHANRIEVYQSRVHGKGVFALCHMAAGETVIEYVGEVITMAEAQRRHPHDPSNPEHTFYFHIDDARVIDGLYGGNDSRWINHSCRPNCEPVEIKGRIFIQTRRQVWRGEELTFNYGLVSDEPITDALKAKYACRCGAKKCKGTMLAEAELQ